MHCFCTLPKIVQQSTIIFKPDLPWDWCIYLDLALIYGNVGKYTSPRFGFDLWAVPWSIRGFVGGAVMCPDFPYEYG